MLTDVRTAVRGFRKAPGFTSVALVIIALGIGASTAIFSVVDAVMLRGLPFPEPDRLVWVGQTAESTREPTGAQAPQSFIEWRAGQQALEGLAAVTGGSGYILRSGGEGLAIRTRRVTYELFDLLRVRPMLGRPWTAEHEVEGQHRVAVLSYGFWQRQFGGDTEIVGKTMPLDTGGYQIVAVMPPGFAYPLGLAEPPEMWVPYALTPSERVRANDHGYYLQLVGRLKPGISIAQAETQLTQLNAPIAAAFPDWFKDSRMTVRPLQESLVGRMRPWMLLLTGAVGVVLLLACVNVANLLLARGMSRQRELSIRAALGASRWQIARSLLVESLALGLAGGLLGLAVTWAGVELLRSSLPANLPKLGDVTIDVRVLAASAVAALSTGVLFGVLPALQFSRPDVTSALRDGGRSMTPGADRQRLRSLLVMGEVALAVVLLIGSGLFMSSFARVTSIDLGIDHERILTLGVPINTPQDMDGLTDADKTAVAARNRQTLEAVLANVQAVAGVERAAIFQGATPLTGGSNSTSAVRNGRQFHGPAENSEIKRVTPDYHVALGIPLRAGRFFTTDDRQGGAPVIILNDAAAAKYFEGEPPIGQTIDLMGRRTVVGIVGSVRQNGPEQPLRPEAYVPLAQVNASNGTLVIRTAGDPLALLPAVKRAVLDVLPRAVFTSRTFEQYLNILVSQRKFNMWLFSLFGLLGLVIAVVGVYGVMAYTVEQRRPEFGVRLALGAAPGRILTMVIGRAGLFLAVGLAVGTTVAFMLSRLVTTFLFQVAPNDPIVYLAVAALLGLAGLVAALIPALRASNVDPVVALRSQ